MKNQRKILIFLTAIILLFSLTAESVFAVPAPEEDDRQVLMMEFSGVDTKLPVSEKVSPYAKAAAKKAGQTLKIDNNTKGMSKQQARVYRKLKQQKKKLPEGMEWTNMTGYAFKGGYFSMGFGCSAFVFKLSDIAFTKKATMHKKFNKIKVGDIVRMDDNTHSVIVMKVVGKYLVVAEGNYNYSIHWGRIISLSEVKATGTYVMTRY